MDGFDAERFRSIAERAMNACGAHVDRGSEVWEAFRSFEREMTESNDVETEKRIRQLYRRQLALPLLTNNDVSE